MSIQVSREANAQSVITYVNLNIFNDTTFNKTCKHDFNFPGGILSGRKAGSSVNVICNRADYPLSNVAMYYNPRDIAYTIRQAGSPTTVLEKHIFPKGFYNSIRDVLNSINTNIASVGQFRYTDKIEYKSVTDEASNPTKFLYLPYRLYHLLDGFQYDKYTDKEGLWYIMYEKGTAWRAQEYDTSDRFYNRKAIRVNAQSMYNKTHIENSNTTGYTHSSLLTDQVVLSGRDRQIYIPNQFRKITLTNINELMSFTISVEVEYADGSTFPLELAPGTYFSTLLSFEEN